MTEFTFHDETTAPEESRPLLEKSKAAFGRLPGLHKVMAEAPGLLEGYQKLHELFVNSSFDKDETTVVWQSVNVEPGLPFNIALNPTDETGKAAMNAYIESNVVRDFSLARNPSYPTIGGQQNWDINIGVSGSCNAFYDGSSINFYNAGGGCNNTAF